MQWVLHSFCYQPRADYLTDAAQGQALPAVVAGMVGGSNRRLQQSIHETYIAPNPRATAARRKSAHKVRHPLRLTGPVRPLRTNRFLPHGYIHIKGAEEPVFICALLTMRIS